MDHGHRRPPVQTGTLAGTAAVLNGQTSLFEANAPETTCSSRVPQTKRMPCPAAPSEPMDLAKFLGTMAWVVVSLPGRRASAPNQSLGRYSNGSLQIDDTAMTLPGDPPDPPA